VELNLTKDGGHSWPGGLQPRAGADAPSKAFDATDVIWDFFKRYQLP
jgi:polyhydroxybutyrate depolymerase